MRRFDDPDWAVMHDYEVGVRLGVGIRMPRTPLRFPER